MKYRLLGNSGLYVPEICFGVMTFTGENGWTHLCKLYQKDADELVSTALDLCVNFFDTADIYSDGVSEEMLGKALASRRKEAIITTKCGFRMHPGPNGDGLSRKRIIEACDASLKRLGTDYIDLYFIHSYDFLTPLEETLSAFNSLVINGKVRYIAASNFTSWQLMKAISICEKNGWEKFIALQAYYSLLGREAELEIIPVCQDQGIGIMPWSPLHGGILTGKYRKDKEWPVNTRIKAPGEHLPYNLQKGELILSELEKIAYERNVSISQVALNYLLHKPCISSIVIGAKNKTQLTDNISSINWELSQDEMKKLDEISAPERIYPHWYFDIFRKERR